MNATVCAIAPLRAWHELLGALPLCAAGFTVFSDACKAVQDTVHRIVSDETRTTPIILPMQSGTGYSAEEIVTAMLTDTPHNDQAEPVVQAATALAESIAGVSTSPQEKADIIAVAAAVMGIVGRQGARLPKHLCRPRTTDRLEQMLHIVDGAGVLPSPLAEQVERFRRLTKGLDTTITPEQGAPLGNNTSGEGPLEGPMGDDQ